MHSFMYHFLLVYFGIVIIYFLVVNICNLLYIFSHLTNQTSFLHTLSVCCFYSRNESFIVEKPKSWWFYSFFRILFKSRGKKNITLSGIVCFLNHGFSKKSGYMLSYHFDNEASSQARLSTHVGNKIRSFLSVFAYLIVTA